MRDGFLYESNQILPQKGRLRISSNGGVPKGNSGGTLLGAVPHQHSHRSFHLEPRRSPGIETTLKVLAFFLYTAADDSYHGTLGSYFR